ncbi:MAG: leucine--tRNA ligase [Candidatus Glassbacteria bacterium]
MPGELMKEYDHREIEKKWQTYWERKRLNETDLGKADKKLYVLVMFIYPSGEKLHIGHWYNYGPADTWARYRRLCGYNVFEPIGYDAFGLPAENYAIKHGIHPAKSTRSNIKIIRKQLKAIGAMYDWRAEVDTSSPEYYKWTQWIFLQLYHRNLAYRREASVNWCPSCNTVLANEQVIAGGLCERCSSEVSKKDLVQWFFKITEYADRLLAGLDKIDWPEKTKTMQKNWIGRSEGAEIVFEVPAKFVRSGDGAIKLPVFTTRPDTLYGATYMVLAPEHTAVEMITTPERMNEVSSYKEKARLVSEIERTSTVREKTGVFTGAYAINPVNGEEIPIWISDYILMTYGTGAIMAVPAHDERDFEFAVKYNLPIVEVIREPGVGQGTVLECAYTGPGTMVNSDTFSGMSHEEGARAIVEELRQRGLAEFKVNYKLRDWLISRQRYWGAPIPIIYCDSCGEVPVCEEDLPVLLPEDVDFTPAGDGKSPLARCEGFINTKCPSCGSEARRESDTMDTFVCSSWYFLRYLSPTLGEAPFDSEIARRWLPVDQYVGGAEHAVMHLLYARFITMVLHDLGLIHFEEPFLRLRHQGTITNQGAKMSKSRGNVVNPEQFIEKYGSDTFRMYLMFMGSYEEGGDWDDSGINGIHRFLGRVWRLFLKFKPSFGEGTDFEGKPKCDVDREVLRILHHTIKSVTFDLENFEFNTAISRMMELVNGLYKYTQENETYNVALLGEALKKLNILIAPFAPHFAEELWQICGGKRSVFFETWPSYSEEFLVQDEITIAVQVNGKLRSELRVMRDLDDDSVVKSALEIEKIRGIIGKKPLRRAVVVKNRIVNLVV